MRPTTLAATAALAAIPIALTTASSQAAQPTIVAAHPSTQVVRSHGVTDTSLYVDSPLSHFAGPTTFRLTRRALIVTARLAASASPTFIARHVGVQTASLTIGTANGDGIALSPGDCTIERLRSAAPFTPCNGASRMTVRRDGQIRAVLPIETIQGAHLGRHVTAALVADWSPWNGTCRSLSVIDSGQIDTEVVAR